MDIQAYLIFSISIFIVVLVIIKIFYGTDSFVSKSKRNNEIVRDIDNFPPALLQCLLNPWKIKYSSITSTLLNLCKKDILDLEIVQDTIVFNLKKEIEEIQNLDLFMHEKFLLKVVFSGKNTFNLKDFYKLIADDSIVVQEERKKQSALETKNIIDYIISRDNFWYTWKKFLQKESMDYGLILYGKYSFGKKLAVLIQILIKAFIAMPPLISAILICGSFVALTILRGDFLIVDILNLMFFFIIYKYSNKTYKRLSKGSEIYIKAKKYLNYLENYTISEELPTAHYLLRNDVMIYSLAFRHANKMLGEYYNLVAYGDKGITFIEKVWNNIKNLITINLFFLVLLFFTHLISFNQEQGRYVSSFDIMMIFVIIMCNIFILIDFIMQYIRSH